METFFILNQYKLSNLNTFQIVDLMMILCDAECFNGQCQQCNKEAKLSEYVMKNGLNLVIRFNWMICWHHVLYLFWKHSSERSFEWQICSNCMPSQFICIDWHFSWHSGLCVCIKESKKYISFNFFFQIRQLKPTLDLGFNPVANSCHSKFSLVCGLSICWIPLARTEARNVIEMNAICGVLKDWCKVITIATATP